MKKVTGRSVWISDIHLGFMGCQAEALADFLQAISCEKLYLVGDIIDVWNMKRGLYWPQSHNNIARIILDMAKQGVEVIYIPGNHDEVLRHYNGLGFGNIKIKNRVIHHTADGKRLMVMHGDEFDSVIKFNPLLAHIGCHAYDYLIRINQYVNAIRKKFGKPYWSLSAYLKYKVKNAINFISQYEHILAHAAKSEKVDGVICGHIHHAEIKTIEGIQYFNTGDWVESCTALVEDFNGKIKLVRWVEQLEQENQPEPSNIEKAA